MRCVGAQGHSTSTSSRSARPRPDPRSAGKNPRSPFRTPEPTSAASSSCRGHWPTRRRRSGPTDRSGRSRTSSARSTPAVCDPDRTGARRGEPGGRHPDTAPRGGGDRRRRRVVGHPQAGRERWSRAAVDELAGGVHLHRVGPRAVRRRPPGQAAGRRSGDASVEPVVCGAGPGHGPGGSAGGRGDRRVVRRADRPAAAGRGHPVAAAADGRPRHPRRGGGGSGGHRGCWSRSGVAWTSRRPTPSRTTGGISATRTDVRPRPARGRRTVRAARSRPASRTTPPGRRSRRRCVVPSSRH